MPKVKWWLYSFRKQRYKDVKHKLQINHNLLRKWIYLFTELACFNVPFDKNIGLVSTCKYVYVLSRKTRQWPKTSSYSILIPVGVNPSIFQQYLWHKETDVRMLPCSVNCNATGLHASRNYSIGLWQTDARADRRTDGQRAIARVAAYSHVGSHSTSPCGFNRKACYRDYMYKAGRRHSKVDVALQLR